jgi:hypothetical protein
MSSSMARRIQRVLDRCSSLFFSLVSYARNWTSPPQHKYKLLVFFFGGGVYKVRWLTFLFYPGIGKVLSECLRDMANGLQMRFVLSLG